MLEAVQFLLIGIALGSFGTWIAAHHLQAISEKSLLTPVVLVLGLGSWGLCELLDCFQAQSPVRLAQEAFSAAIPFASLIFVCRRWAAAAGNVEATPEQNSN